MAETNSSLFEGKRTRKKKSLVALAFSAAVVTFAVLALVISVCSIFEKIRLSQGLQQVFNVVGQARDAVKTDPNLIASGHKDLLDAMEHAGRLKTDSSTGNVKALKNPWGNNLTSFVTATNDEVRVENMLLSRVCQRFIGFFGQDPQSFGVKNIEVKGSDNNWYHLYDSAMAGGVSESAIADGCSDTAAVDAAITFSLH